MPNNFSLHNAIYTTRSIRKFKPDPIPHDTIRLILEAGTQGPSGKNIQPWRFIVVQGPKQKKQLARLYSEAFFENRPSEIDDPDTNASAYLARNLDKAPAIIVVCAPVTQPTGIGQIGPFASTFPAIQNMLLTARAHGMGGTITINHVFRHEEMKSLLAIPEDRQIVAVIPIGFLGEEEGHGTKSRKEVSEVAFQESWGVPFSASHPD